jgi:hypothetical protein
MDINKIEIGDIVDVHFSYANPLKNAKVILPPHFVGNKSDCWILKADTIHYVRNFEYMSLVIETTEKFELT